MKDICFTQKNSTVIQPTILGKITDQNQILYQKILVLTLSNIFDTYRQSAGCVLINLLQGSNIPDDNILSNIGTTACAKVYQCLDADDVNLIKNLQAYASNGQLIIKLQTIDGSVYTGGVAG